jgi:hypothetical protein
MWILNCSMLLQIAHNAMCNIYIFSILVVFETQLLKIIKFNTIERWVVKMDYHTLYYHTYNSSLTQNNLENV